MLTNNPYQIQNPNPIFVVGFPRSGTTLAQSLLAQDSLYFSLPETHFFSFVCPALGLKEPEQTVFADFDLVKAALQEHIPTPLSDFDLRWLKINLKNGQITAKELFEWLVVSLFEQLNPGKKARRKILIEKTPDHARHLPLIQKFYPEANFLIIVRHPAPTLASCRKNIESLRKRTLIDLCERWKTTYQLATDFEKRNPNFTRLIQYESLIEMANQTEVHFWIAKPIFKQGNQTLDSIFFGQNEESRLANARKLINENESWKQKVLEPIDPNSNDKTVAEMAENDLYEIQFQLKSWLSRFKYKPYYPAANLAYYLKRISQNLLGVGV